MTKRALSRGNQLTVSKIWDYLNGVAEVFGRKFDDLCRGKVAVEHIDIVSKSHPSGSGKIHRISFAANGFKFSSPTWGSTKEMIFFVNGVVGALAKEPIPTQTPPPVADQGFGSSVFGSSLGMQHEIEVRDQKIADLTFALQQELGEKKQLLQAMDQAATFLNKQYSQHSS